MFASFSKSIIYPRKCEQGRKTSNANINLLDARKIPFKGALKFCSSIKCTRKHGEIGVILELILHFICYRVVEFLVSIFNLKLIFELKVIFFSF